MGPCFAAASSWERESALRRRWRSAARSGRGVLRRRVRQALSAARPPAGTGYGPTGAPGDAQDPALEFRCTGWHGARRSSRPPATAGTWPPTARPRSQPMTAADPRLELGGAARRRGGHSLRPRRRDPRRLPHPRGHDQQLRAAARRRGARARRSRRYGEGRVWECDPAGRREASARREECSSRGGGGRPAGRRVYLWRT